MKAKSIILSVAFVTMAVVSVHAQGFQLGIKGGANIFKITDNSGTYSHALDNEFKYGYSLGGFAVINISKHIGIQPEILWNEYQTRTTSDANTVYENLWTDKNITLNYLSIPLLLNISPAKIITFQIGPQFGILINQSQTFVNNANDAFKKGDFSMLGGVQLNLAWLKVGGRYAIGLNNISDVPNTNTWKSQGFQVYVGVRII
jgi:hypothetical protein